MLLSMISEFVIYSQIPVVTTSIVTVLKHELCRPLRSPFFFGTGPMGSFATVNMELRAAGATTVFEE